MNIYSLRLYDEELLSFSLKEKGLEGLQASILNTNTQENNCFHLTLN